MAETTEHKAILSTDSDKVATGKASSRKSRKPAVAKSRKRTSLHEFAFVNNLRPEVAAGFRAWLAGEEYHFDDEWADLYKEYMSR